MVYGELQADNLQTLVQETVKVRGLAPLQPIPFRLVKRTALQPERLEEPGEADKLLARDRLLRALGVVQGSESLLDAQRRLFRGGAVFGFYAGAGRGITMVDSGLHSDIGELVAAFRRRDPVAAELAHEITHALQDQHFKLDPWLNVAKTTDERLARQALVEGDASLTQALYDGLLSPAARARLFRALLMGGSNPSAEAFHRRQAHLVYADGSRFAEALHSGGGFEAVNAAYARPPASTFEILYPRRYSEGFKPTPVELPVLAGGQPGPPDRLGAWTLALLLRALQTPAKQRRALVAAWRGDRATLLSGGQALWSLEMATPAAADDLVTLAKGRCSARAKGTRVDLLCPGGPGDGGLPPAEPSAEAARTRTTPEATPEAQPEATPEAQLEATPEAQPEATPEAQPEATPEAQPAATPEAQPEATPGAPAEATPDAPPGPPLSPSDYVVVEPGPPATLLSEPLLRIERSGAPTSFGGHVRLLSQARPRGAQPWTADEPDDMTLDAALRVEGQALPLLGIGYAVEIELPRGDGTERFGLRQAFARMQLASTPLLGEMRWGVMRVPLTQDSERRSVERPLLRPGAVESMLGQGSQLGFMYRLDRRTTWMPLLLDVGTFLGPEDEEGDRQAGLVVRAEVQLWGHPNTYRDGALGVAINQVGVEQELRWFGWGRLRWRRLLMEAEVAFAAPDDPDVYSARAWQGLLAFDLLPQFLQLGVAVADRDGRKGLADLQDARLLSPALSMFMWQRRLAIHALVDLVDTDRDNSHDVTVTRMAFDLSF